MMTAQESLTLQFLDWLAEKPRRYAEIMDAWKTSCPRLAIWEDACDAGLIAKTSDDFFRLSPKGDIFRRDATR